MPNRNQTRIPTDAKQPSTFRPNGLVTGDNIRPGTRQLNDAQMGRWAELVAAGEESLPQDLEPDQALALTDRVRQLRRDRLVSFIARQVALEFHRRGSAESGTSVVNVGRSLVTNGAEIHD